MSLSSIYQSISKASFGLDLSKWVARLGAPAKPEDSTRKQATAYSLALGEQLSVRGAAGSLPAFLTAHIYEEASRPILCVLEDADSAAFFCSDLQQIFGSDEQVILLPASDSRPFDAGHVPDPAPIIQRADVMQRLAASYSGIIVTSVDALTEKVSSSSRVMEASLDIEVGQKEDPELLIERLVSQGFTRTEFVEAPGDLALRGGILDLFPYSGAFPIRIEFFGDEIDSIREFDIHTQRSVSRRT
ncbi:hypothetical protein HQ496_06920, partial [bacterium]|nr:hypothetical protein [bacterium]